MQREGLGTVDDAGADVAGELIVDPMLEKLVDAGAEVEMGVSVETELEAALESDGCTMELAVELARDAEDGDKTALELGVIATELEITVLSTFIVRSLKSSPLPAWRLKRMRGAVAAGQVTTSDKVGDASPDAV